MPGPYICMFLTAIIPISTETAHSVAKKYISQRGSTSSTEDSSIGHGFHYVGAPIGGEL